MYKLVDIVRQSMNRSNKEGMLEFIVLVLGMTLNSFVVVQGTTDGLNCGHARAFARNDDRCVR